MKKFKKLIIGIFTALVCAIMIIPADMAGAADNSLTISVSSDNIIEGGSITVKVALNYSKGIGAAQFNLVYDKNMFSCGGYDGVIPITYMEMTSPTYLEWEYTFTAKQVGTAQFSIQEVQFVDASPDPEAFHPSLGTASVKVWKTGSDDATLSGIQIGGATLSPAFAKWTMDYTCYVSNEITSVTVSAPSSQGGKVEIAGNYTALAVGNNYITITSYAPNGKAMTYKVNIVRLEPPTEPPSTEPPTEPPADIAIRIDGKEYNVSSDYSQDIIPAGYSAELGTYNGKEVLVVRNEAFGITLMYLTDSEKEGAFYIYDGDNFYRYVTLSSINGSFTVYDSRKAGEGLDGEEKDILIGDSLIKGYEDSADENFIYFYGMNGKKEFSWYSYDRRDGSVQRMNVPSFDGQEKETVTEPESSGETGTYSQHIKENKNNIFSFRNIFVITTVILAVVVVILGIILGITGSRKEKEPEEVEPDAEAELAATEETVTEKEEAVTDFVPSEDEKNAFNEEAEKLAEYMKQEVADIEDEEAIEMLYVNSEDKK